MTTQLNFINLSNDSNNSVFVIFQKNLAAAADDYLPVAWHVIENCGISDQHPFSFPKAMAIGATDSWGNHTPQMPAQYGAMYYVGRTSEGDRLSPCGPASSNREVQLLNGLSSGAIDGGIYKEGRLLALAHHIAPGRKAAFAFKHNIWIGVASQATEGQVLSANMVANANTELSLDGIASADLVLRGGGPGRNAMPFSFSLENIEMR